MTPARSVLAAAVVVQLYGRAGCEDVEPLPTLDPIKLSWFHCPKCASSMMNIILTWACDLQHNDTMGLGMRDRMEIINRPLHCKEGFNFFMWEVVEHTPLLEESTVPLWRERVAKSPRMRRLKAPGAEGAEGAAEAEGKAGKGRPWEMTTDNPHFQASYNVSFLPNHYATNRPNFVGMFRQPEERIISGFHHGRHGQYAKFKTSQNLMQYALAVQGCTVRMLNGYDCYEDVDTTQAMVDTAVQRVRQDFAFVGLLEHWGLSVCLWHAMFGGECHEREFKNTRPINPRQLEGGRQRVKVSQFKGWRDKLDGAVYEAAAERFWGYVRRLGLNAESCSQRICAGVPSTVWEGQLMERDARMRKEL